MMRKTIFMIFRLFVFPALLGLFMPQIQFPGIASTAPGEYGDSAGIPDNVNKESAGGILTLEQTIKKVLEKNLTLMAGRWGIWAKDGAILQASLFSNPEIEVEVENFAGTGETGGFDRAELTLRIGQPIPLGGKRKKMVAAAKLDKLVTRRNFEVDISDLITETRKNFVTLLHQQKKLALWEEMVGFTEAFMKKISRRVAAGKASPVELTRARILLLNNRLSFQGIEMEIQTGRQHLAAMWGSTRPDFTLVEGNLDIDSEIPRFNQLESRLSRNPDLKCLLSRINFQKSLLALEKSRRIPDPVVSGGIRRLNESDNIAFTFGLSVQVPVIDRGQGTIKNAIDILKEFESGYRAAEVAVRSDLAVILGRLETARHRARTLKTGILPEAFQACVTVSNGYELGKYGYLEVFDAYRFYLELQEAYLEHAANYWCLVADLDRLTGTGLENAGILSEGGKNHEKK